MAKFPDLPPEIQDMILSHVLRLYTSADLPSELENAICLPNMHYKIRAYRKRHDGRELALVCRRWADFVHSRVFKNVYLRRPEKISNEVRFMAKSMNIKRYCGELDVGFGHVSSKHWWGYVRNVWGYLSSLSPDEVAGRKKGKGIKIELRGALKRPYKRIRGKNSNTGRDGCFELPVVTVVDTLVWGIGVGIEDEEWTSRDSTAAIWQKHHPEPWRLSMLLDSLPNLRHLTVLVPDSFGEDVTFHEQMAAEVSRWPTHIRQLNFEYQRKRPTNRVREPVHLRGIEKALADTFRALVKRFSPVLEDLYWSGRTSLDLLDEDCIKNAKWPKLKKIRIDFGNYDLEGNWFFDLQRRRPIPWDPERSEDDREPGEEDEFLEGLSAGSWETDHDMIDDVEHNAGFALDAYGTAVEEYLAEASGGLPHVPDGDELSPIPPSREITRSPYEHDDTYDSYGEENTTMDMDVEWDDHPHISAAIDDVMLEIAGGDGEDDAPPEYTPFPPEVLDALDNPTSAATFDDDDDGGPITFPNPPFSDVDSDESIEPDPDHEWSARYCFNRSKPRKDMLDKLHTLIFGWTRNIPKLEHMLIISDSERSEGNVQLRVVDRRKCLVFYSTEGNAYWPDEKILESCFDKEEWDEVEVEKCGDAWGTCEVNLRFTPDMLDYEDD